MPRMWRDGSFVSGLRWLALGCAQTPLHPQWFSFTAKRKVLARIGEDTRGMVLDIGCGDGAARALLPTGCTYIGFDYPLTGRDWYGARPDVFGDACALPFAGAIFDRVLLLDVVEHLAEPERSLSEAFRVLAPAGRMYLSIPYLYPMHDEPQDFQRFTIHGLRLRVEKAGFVDVCIKPFGAPAETAGLLTNIALCKGLADMTRVFPLALLLLWPLLALVPLINVCASLLAWMLPRDGLMPYGYFLECTKPGVSER